MTGDSPAHGTTAQHQSLFGLEGIVGFMAALFLLSGRWSPARLLDSAQVRPVFELRFWIVIGLLLLLLLPVRRNKLGSSMGIPGGRLVLLTLMFLGYMAISIGWAPDVGLALLKAYELALLGVSILTIHRWLGLSDGCAMRTSFWTWILLATLTIALLAVVNIVASTAVVRTSVLAGGPNTFGRMMGLLCLASLFMWQRRGRTWLWIPTCIGSVFLVIMSGSRGAMLAVSLSVMLFVFVERIRFGKVLALCTTALLASTIILWYTPLGRTASTIFQYRVIDLSIEKRYMAGRESIYLDALELGLDNPLVGAGLAGFPAQGFGVYPHNIFLEAFSEGGAIGLLTLLIVLFSFAGSMKRNRERIDGVSISAFLLVLVFSLFSGDFYDNRTVFMLMLLALVPRTSTSVLDRFSKRDSRTRISPRAGGALSPGPIDRLEPTSRRRPGLQPESGRAQ